MPELTFTGDLPSQAAFRQALAEAMAAANPVDDLLMLAERLREYEQQNRMSSASFHDHYQAGKLDDSSTWHRVGSDLRSLPEDQASARVNIDAGRSSA